ICAVLLSTVMGHPVEMKPLMVSKANTAVLIVLAAEVLAELTFGLDLGWVRSGLVLLSARLTGASAAAYLVGWLRHMSGYGEGTPPSSSRRSRRGGCRHGDAPPGGCLARKLRRPRDLSLRLQRHIAALPGRDGPGLFPRSRSRQAGTAWPVAGDGNRAHTFCLPRRSGPGIRDPDSGACHADGRFRR